MPHVVLEGRITIDDCEKAFEPFVLREGDLVVKAGRFYRESRGRAALIETLVNDAGHTQKFFIQLSVTEKGITVRLEPLTDPEKGRGIRRALAMTAKQFRDASGCEYGSTNIGEFLSR